ncbi:B-box zinc finger protein 22-like [Asparagus officinalis]|uniref:B-box zinc finger protein 22-like n=1 Tax=Asparagus officinalis TaxID=4686 RepID=UPI00098E64A8|nr:B-box zinc finger protein 22-like [Asparagus officinalis]
MCPSKTAQMLKLLEDRALLCRNCDIGIHTASAYGSSHQRFLITGVRVGLQHYLTDNNSNITPSSINNNDRSNSSSSNGNNNNNHIIPQATSNSSMTNEKAWSVDANEGDGFGAQWMWNEVLFDSAEFSQCYGISEPGSSS